MNVFKGQPPYPPHRCAVFTYRNGTDPETRFIDTGVDFEVGAGFERLYLSEAAVKDMSREFGHPSADEHATALAENAALKARLEDLEADMKEYDRRFQAIDILESADFRARRKAGRPPKQPTQKAA